MAYAESSESLSESTPRVSLVEVYRNLAEHLRQEEGYDVDAGLARLEALIERLETAESALPQLVMRVLAVHELRHEALASIEDLANVPDSERHLKAFTFRVSAEGELRGLLVAYWMFAGEPWSQPCEDPDCPISRAEVAAGGV